MKVGDTVFVSGKTCAIQSGYYDVVQGAGANMKLTGSINNVAVNIAESDIITANMDVYRVSLLVSARRSGRFEIEEPLGAFAPAAGVANSLSDYFVPIPNPVPAS